MIGAAIREAFRQMPNTGIWTRSGNRHISVGPQRIPSSTFDIVAFSATVLGHDSPDRIALLTWGRLTAQNGEDTAGVNEWCAEKGWRKSTFYRRRDRACAKIARAKNAADLTNQSPGCILYLDSATACV